MRGGHKVAWRVGKCRLDDRNGDHSTGHTDVRRESLLYTPSETTVITPATRNPVVQRVRWKPKCPINTRTAAAQ
jgi:hypothetical protein